MADLKLIDPCNRYLNYLRISITDRCNLKCIYCVPRDQIPRLSHDEILTYEEILRLVKVGVTLGISKIRVTGGEPLVRKGVYAFLSELSRIKGLSVFSMISAQESMDLRSIPCHLRRVLTRLSIRSRSQTTIDP